MEKLVETLGVTRLSPKVSEMAKDLDGQVEAFRSDRGRRALTFVAADALVLKYGERGRQRDACSRPR